MLLLVLLIINFPANLRFCDFGQPCEVQILQGMSPTNNRRLASLRKVWPHFILYLAPSMPCSLTTLTIDVC